VEESRAEKRRVEWSGREDGAKKRVKESRRETSEVGDVVIITRNDVLYAIELDGYR
jgi:hypothetical protein